jgi:hypothetical protein
MSSCRCCLNTPSGLPEDATGLEALFDVGFDELRRRVRAGDAVWLGSGFFQLNELYWLRSEPGGDRELPVFGGRQIPDPGGGPGRAVLGPPEVARAAAYLEGGRYRTGGRSGGNCSRPSRMRRCGSA